MIRLFLGPLLLSLWSVVRLLLLVILLLTTLLLGALATDPGNRLLVTLATEHAPELIQVHRVQGNMLQGLTLHGVRLHTPGAEVAISRAYLDLDVLPLLRGRLRLAALDVYGLEVDLPAAPAATDDQKAPPQLALPDAITLPLRLDLHRVLLEEARIRQNGEEMFYLERLHLQAWLDPEDWQLRNLHWQSPEVVATLSAQLQPSASYPLRLDGHWSAPVPEALGAALSASRPPTDPVTGVLQIEGALLDTLTVQHQLYLNAVPQASAFLDSRLVLSQLFAAHPHLDMQHAWSGLEYALDATQAIEIAPGQMHFGGTLEQWQARVQAGAQLQDWPEVSLHGHVQGSSTQIEVTDLTLSSPAGRLQAQGELALGATLGWQVQLAIHEFSSQALGRSELAALALELEHLALSSQGQWQPGTQSLQFTAELDALQGQVQQQPVHGQVQVTWAADQLDIAPGSRIHWGANQLAMEGAVGDSLDLRLALQGTDLSALMPGLRGRLDLQADLQGPRAQPRIRAQGSGQQLAYQDFSLANLSLEARLGLRPTDPAELQLQLNGLHLSPEQQVPELTLSLSGQAAQHRLALQVDADALGRLALSAQGGYDLERQRWNGDLLSLELAQALAGAWSLQQVTSLQLGAQRAGLAAPLCLGREAARLCLTGAWEAGQGGQGQVQLQDFDLAWLQSLLPDDLVFVGTLDATISATQTAAGQLSAELSVQPSPGTAHIDLGGGLDQAIPYSDAHVQAQWRAGTAEGHWQMAFLENGQLDAVFQITPEGPDSPISAQLNLALTSLHWLGALSADIQNVEGALHADLAVAGTLAAPELTGGLRLTEAGVTLPEAGLRLEIPSLAILADDYSQLRVTGTIVSEEQPLHLAGTISLAEPRWHTEMTLRGTDVLAVKRPNIQAYIDSDLRLRFAPDTGTRLDGRLTIPRAQIAPPDFPPGAVRVSTDEIIMGEPAVATTPLPLYLNIRVILGDAVRFKGYGLEARVTGDLDLIATPERPLQAFGDIEVVEGNYRAYGQDLMIERGLILFQGPLEQPALDLRAVRTVRQYNVVAGLEIGGTPEALNSRVFSEPSMDDTEAMAYLLTGRPLSGATESDGNLMAGAALAWGLEQGGMLTERTGVALGLDEFALDTEDGLDHSALRIGTYLSPRLLLRYSRGLFDDSFEVMLRYEISRSLSVETSSRSDGQGVDFIYRIER